MNVMNGLIAVGLVIAVFVFILGWVSLLARYPMETFLGTIVALMLVAVFLVGAQA